MNAPTSIFAPPRSVSSIEDCYFYHSMNIPGHGEVTGEWDLRGRERDYLGNVDLAGKSVLEIGTASGHLCFWMEKQGAMVVGFDLSEHEAWDIVPYWNQDFSDHLQTRKDHIRKLNNSWWYSHERFQSKARVVYGAVYDLPRALGSFDIVTLGSILLHLRDPFLAMQKAASLARDTLIVTDKPLSLREQAIATMLGNGRVVRFLPDAGTRQPLETWWLLSPGFVIETLRIFGFDNITSSHHHQRYRDKEIDLYTIVAKRGLPTDSPRDQALSRRDLNRDYSLHHAIMSEIPGLHVVKHLGTRVLRRLRAK